MVTTLSKNTMASQTPARSDVIQLIQECYEQEKLSPPVPRRYGDIPISYDAITTVWLTATLAPHTGGAVVKSFTLGPKDDGSSNRRRIQLEWEGTDTDTSKLPASVFCKAAHALENRIIMSSAGTYSEVCFYNHVRPRLDIEAPTAYFAGYNPTSWASMIMLKDMGGAAVFCTHKTALTKVQAFEQIQILATLHGQNYRSKEPFFENLIGYKNRFDSLVLNLDLETVCDNGFKASKDVMPPRLFAREAEIWPATVKSVERNASLPQTVVHGDVHLGEKACVGSIRAHLPS